MGWSRLGDGGQAGGKEVFLSPWPISVGRRRLAKFSLASRGYLYQHLAGVMACASNLVSFFPGAELMKRQSLYLALAAVLIICPAIAAGAESILGEWLALERTRDGLGVTKTYTKGGSVEATYGSLIDYRYNLAGKKLILSAPPKEPFVLYVEIKGSKLTLTDISGNKQKLTRVSGNQQSGIIGKWSGDHHAGKKQVMHFTASRNCYVSVPIVTEKGSYNIKGDNLTERFKGKRGERKWQWTIDYDILSITSRTKDESEKYRRKE